MPNGVYDYSDEIKGPHASYVGLDFVQHALNLFAFDMFCALLRICCVSCLRVDVLIDFVYCTAPHIANMIASRSLQAVKSSARKFTIMV